MQTKTFTKSHPKFTFRGCRVIVTRWDGELQEKVRS